MISYSGLYGLFILYAAEVHILYYSFFASETVQRNLLLETVGTLFEMALHSSNVVDLHAIENLSVDLSF